MTDHADDCVYITTRLLTGTIDCCSCGSDDWCDWARDELVRRKHAPSVMQAGTICILRRALRQIHEMRLERVNADNVYKHLKLVHDIATQALEEERDGFDERRRDGS